MTDEQPMEPSEPEQTARPEPAAPPQPDAPAEPPQPTQEDPPSAESTDRDAQPPSPSEQATPEQQLDPEAGTGADPEAEGPSIDEVIRERDAHRDRLLRVSAEFDNYKKRTERERRALIEQAAGDLLGDLLPVVDDLELALAADAQDGESYRRGVEGIRRKLLDVMDRRGVAPIEAVGAEFDPTLHEAMTYEPAEGRRDGEVVEDLRRGYTLRGKLLRASMVKVAKA